MVSSEPPPAFRTSTMVSMTPGPLGGLGAFAAFATLGAFATLAFATLSAFHVVVILRLFFEILVDFAISNSLRCECPRPKAVRAGTAYPRKVKQAHPFSVREFP